MTKKVGNSGKIWKDMEQILSEKLAPNAKMQKESKRVFSQVLSEMGNSEDMKTQYICLLLCFLFFFLCMR